MASFISRFPMEKLRNYRGPGLYFGGGLLAGLLLFLIWLATLPPSDKAVSEAQALATTAAATKPQAGADGVLGDITGSPTPGQSSTVETTPDQQSPTDGQDAPDAAGSAEAAADPGVGGDAAPAAGDEQAIADALLPPEQQPAAPVLQTYYVEVARGPGVTEILQVNAESADNALAIIRDFRGNPKVTRGPSTRPLD
jgi:hypothetical protein